MEYETNAIAFLNILQGSILIEETSDVCIEPKNDSIKIISYSTDLLVCVITELYCEVKNYKKENSNLILFPVFEIILRLPKVNLKESSILKIKISKYLLETEIKIDESLSLTFTKNKIENIPSVFNFSPTPIENYEKSFKIKKETFMCILNSCDEEDIIEFKTKNDRLSISIMNPYSWDNVKYFTELNGCVYKETAIQYKNLFNFVKYLTKYTKIPLQIWSLGENAPFNCKINGGDYESLIYISPFIYKRESKESEDLIKETIEYIINQLEK